MYGWQVMINSFSKILELQKAISLKPFGQIGWGFLQQVTFDPLFPNMQPSCTKTLQIKMAFFHLHELFQVWYKNEFLR
jgi:hypothetical protein